MPKVMNVLNTVLTVSLGVLLIGCGSASSSDESSGTDPNITPSQISVSDLIGSWGTACLQGDTSDDLQTIRSYDFFASSSVEVTVDYYGSADTSCTGAILATESVSASYSLGDDMSAPELIDTKTMDQAIPAAVSSSALKSEIDYIFSSWTLTPRNGTAASLSTDSWCGVSSWSDYVAQDISGATCGGTTIPSLYVTYYGAIQLDEANSAVYLSDYSASEVNRPTQVDTDISFENEAAGSGGVDLSVAIDSVTYDGSDVTVTYTVTNNGSETTDGSFFTVKIWENADSTADLDTALYRILTLWSSTSATVNSVIAGNGGSRTVSKTFYATLTSGTAWVSVDTGDDIVETDEDNNISNGYAWGGSDTTPPAAPSGFSAIAGDGQVTLNWTNPTDVDFAQVEIRRASDTTPDSVTAGTSVYTGSGTSTLDTGLTNDTPYYYSIFARDDNSNWSSPVSTSGVPTASAGGSTTFTYTNDASQDIPDGDISTGVSSSITIANGATSIEKVTVTINITHTWDTDLDIYLEAPGSGSSIIDWIALSEDNGSSGDNYTDTIFDSDATDDISSGTAPFTGTFRPSGSLSSLVGSSAVGDWILHVYDDLGGDTGTLNNWSLSVTGTGATGSD